MRTFAAASSHSANYGDNVAWDGFGNKFAVAFCVTSTGWNNTRGLVNKRDSSSSNNSFSIGTNYDSANEMAFQVGNASGGDFGACKYYCSTSGWATNTKIHILAVYDGSLGAGARMVIYKDGVAQSMSVFNEGNPSLHAGSASLVLGRVNSTGSFYWDGDLAEVAIWAAALKADHATALARRYSPALIRPAALRFYDSLIRSTRDRQTNARGTTSASLAAHPRMLYPCEPYVVGASDSASFIDNTPQILRRLLGAA